MNVSNEYFLAHHLADNMLARLDFMTLQPQVIVDLDCQVTYSAELLKKRYPGAKIIEIARGDVETGMLPLQNHSVDLIFANLVLPWVSDLKKILVEWRRILKPEGVLIFSSLGPDTLKELAFLRDQVIPALVDMHDLGDALMQARLADPVLDMEYITVRYQQVEKLLHELYVTEFLSKKIDLQPERGNSVMTYEVVYGHAFGAGEMVDHTADEEGVVRIPLAHLRRRGNP